eukprot:gene31764-25129_t
MTNLSKDKPKPNLESNVVGTFADILDTSWTRVHGDACHNGQASFWYSQGCFIGCKTCDHVSGRRQTDLCGAGFKATNNAE